MAANPTQCAVGADGQLLDASQITWFEDAESTIPLPSLSSSTQPAGTVTRQSTLDNFAKRAVQVGAVRTSRRLRPAHHV